MAVDRDFRSGRASQIHPTSGTSKPLASASTLISTFRWLLGLRYSSSRASRSLAVVSQVNTAAITPDSMNLRQSSSQCLIVAPKTMVLRLSPNLCQSRTTFPTIFSSRSSAALSVHSPPAVSAPSISGLEHEKILIGTSTPDSVRSCIVVAFTRFVKIFPKPIVNGVADNPITVAPVSTANSVHAL